MELTEVNKDNSSKTPEVGKKEYIVKNLAKKIQVSFWLDDYDNLFSDFDPRPFSHRSLSDDFLTEVKKALIEINTENLEILLLIPHNLKNKAEEHIIQTRIHAHFKKLTLKLEKEHKKYIKNGLLLTLGGMALMLAATSIYYLSISDFLINFLRTLFEPTGWFMAWYGLDHIFYISKENRHELEFSKKMSKANIKFDVY